MTARHSSTDSERAHDMAPQYSSAGGEQTCEATLLLEAATMDAGEQVLEAPLPQGDMAERTPKVLPQGSLTEGMTGRDRDVPQREGTMAHEHELKTLQRGPPIKRGHIALSRSAVGTSACRLTRGDLTGHRPSWPSRERTSKCIQPLRETPLKGRPTTLEARGTYQPKKAPPWRERGPSRPEKRAWRASLLAQEDTPGRQKSESARRHHQWNWPHTFFFACTTSNRPFRGRVVEF
jgi:hypothetical protein